MDTERPGKPPFDEQAVAGQAPASSPTRERSAALLAKRQELDATEAKYKKLAAEYGGNRRARRRARAEVDREVRKRGTAG
jgi:hypothetical protein